MVRACSPFMFVCYDGGCSRPKYHHHCTYRPPFNNSGLPFLFYRLNFACLEINGICYEFYMQESQLIHGNFVANIFCRLWKEEDEEAKACHQAVGRSKS